MKKILFLVQLPPPTHGASVTNQNVKDSELLNKAFGTRYVNISPARDITDVGRLSVSKIFSTVLIVARAMIAFVTFRPSLVYLTLSPHGMAFYKDGFLALLLKLCGARMVFHMHGKGIAEVVSRSKVKRLLYRSVFKSVDIIHLSESLFVDVDDVRDRSRAIVAVPNGVSLIRCVANRGRVQTVTFIYLSNLIRSKGADVLVRAAMLIPGQYQHAFQVKLIGKPSDEEYAAEVKHLISSHEFDNIALLGPKYGEAKESELRSSHVFVLPTRFKNECFPLTILEAMAAGLAIISTNEGAIPDIVEPGLTGDLLEEVTPQSLAEVMLRHIQSRDYSESCGDAGRRKYQQNYTLAIFEKRLVSALNGMSSSQPDAHGDCSTS